MRGGALAVALLLLATGCADDAPPPAPMPAAGAPRVRLEIAGVSVRARVVARHDARRAGLMGVRSLEPDEGMLFVYRSAERRSFWMQGCLIPLDIAFLAADGTVLQVDTLAPPAPGEEPARTRRSPPAVYALEVGAGFFARHAIGPGTRVRIPPSVKSADADP